VSRKDDAEASGVKRVHRLRALACAAASGSSAGVVSSAVFFVLRSAQVVHPLATRSLFACHDGTAEHLEERSGRGRTTGRAAGVERVAPAASGGLA
jgi:hypothetical protein